MKQVLYRVIVDVDALADACRDMSVAGIEWEILIPSRTTERGAVAELEVWGNDRALWPASVFVHRRERKLLRRVARQHHMAVLRTSALVVHVPAD